MRLKNVKGANLIIEKGIYYVNNPYDNRGNWNKIFKNDNPIYIEIGMGKGDFIVQNALRYPNINFIGIEKFDSVIVRAIQKTNELELNNLLLIKDDALNLDKIFDKEIDTIYLNFSDPWPKAKHAKRRLTSPIFLDIYDKIFKNDKKIIMKTDNDSLFDYSLESLSLNGYDIIFKTNNLSNEDDNIMTEYEKKFREKGKNINKLIAKKK